MAGGLREDARAALAWVQRGQAVFDAAALALGRACAPAGALQATALDAHQLASFELAWAGAELLVARTQLAALDGASSALDVQLALISGVGSLTDALARLEWLHLELGLPLQPLQAIGNAPGWLALRQRSGSAQALAAAGAAVARGGVDIGPVPLDDTAAQAQEAFRRFAREVVAPQAEAIHRQDLTVPESLLQPLREMGVFGLAIPEGFGGSAVDGQDNTPLMLVVTEALSEASLAAAGSLITRPEILSRALLAGGTEAQKAHWLPAIARGEPLCAIAITEPDFGSDVASLQLKATRVEGGWQLNGAKTWCTFAGKAGLLMVVARTGAAAGHKGLSLLLVQKPSFEGHEFEVQQQGGGRLLGRAIPTLGYRGMHSFDLSFQDYFVPSDALLGGAAGEGQGFYFTMAGMVGGRLQTAARACGVMRAALNAAVAYAQQRQVFGAPLASLQLTQAKLARMAARLAGCRQLAHAVARQVDAGGGRMEASLVKLLACRAAEWVTREAMQLHGGMGYAEEVATSRYFVDARVLSIFEGAEETLALKVVARGLLEAALATATPSAA